MDREIDSKIRRLRIFKRAAIAVALLLASSAALIWGPAWIRPSVHRSQIRTATVD